MKHIRDNMSEFLNVISVDELLKNTNLEMKVSQLKEYLDYDLTEEGELIHSVERKESFDE